MGILRVLVGISAVVPSEGISSPIRLATVAAAGIAVASNPPLVAARNCLRPIAEVFFRFSIPASLGYIATVQTLSSSARLYASMGQSVQINSEEVDPPFRERIS